MKLTVDKKSRPFVERFVALSLFLLSACSTSNLQPAHERQQVNCEGEPVTVLYLNGFHGETQYPRWNFDLDLRIYDSVEQGTPNFHQNKVSSDIVLEVFQKEQIKCWAEAGDPIAAYTYALTKVEWNEGNVGNFTPALEMMLVAARDSEPFRPMCSGRPQSSFQLCDFNYFPHGLPQAHQWLSSYYSSSDTNLSHYHFEKAMAGGLGEAWYVRTGWGTDYDIMLNGR